MSGFDYITIKRFNSIASDEKLSLGAVNVVIGPNGSGKSNLPGVFEFHHEVRAGHLQEYVIKAGGADKVPHFGSKVTSEGSIGMSFDSGRHSYPIDLQHTASDEFVPRKER